MWWISLYRGAAAVVRPPKLHLDCIPQVGQSVKYMSIRVPTALQLTYYEAQSTIKRTAEAHLLSN